MSSPRCPLQYTHSLTSFSFLLARCRQVFRPQAAYRAPYPSQGHLQQSGVILLCAIPYHFSDPYSSQKCALRRASVTQAQLPSRCLQYCQLCSHQRGRSVLHSISSNLKRAEPDNETGRVHLRLLSTLIVILSRIRYPSGSRILTDIRQRTIHLDTGTEVPLWLCAYLAALPLRYFFAGVDSLSLTVNPCLP